MNEITSVKPVEHTAAASPPPVSLTTKYGWTVPILLGIALLLAIFASLGVGMYPMSWGHSARLLLDLLWPFHPLNAPAPDLRELTVVKIIRPPRVLEAAFAGLGLGMAGTALQGMLRNPLVSADILGVTSGAAFGGALAIAVEATPTTLLCFGFAGGFLAITSVFTVAKLARGSGNGTVLVLAGVFIGAFFLALTGLVEAYGNIFRLVHWLIGSFTNSDWEKVATIAIPTLAGGAVLMKLRWRLNLLSLGDLDAISLGINVTVLRWAIIAVVSLMVAAQVAVSGIVAWVGLVVPHCARMLVGPDHRRLLPTAALLGALFVLGLDDLSRTFVRTALPVGVLSALIGTPVVCILLWRSQGKGWGRE
jgi:iron complex transport system permease protein